MLSNPVQVRTFRLRRPAAPLCLLKMKISIN
jgi:hypothetical protein